MFSSGAGFMVKGGAYGISGVLILFLTQTS
jgi:hypothetical protein